MTFMNKERQYVLTADRSLMSHYRDNMLFGFIVCFPAQNVPPFMFKQVFCPAVPFDKGTGEADAAPLGLRRIEAGLIQNGSGRFDGNNVIIAHPDHIDKSIGQDTRIIGVNVMDPLGVGPFPSATTQGQVVTVNRVIFRDLCMKIKNLKQKYGFKVVVGGSGAWQLSFNKNIREEYGIDHLVVGETDDKIAEIYQNIMANNAQE
jgi:radical SAM superfamily enzyme YgiQ (UPF0313 family)